LQESLRTIPVDLLVLADNTGDEINQRVSGLKQEMPGVRIAQLARRREKTMNFQDCVKFANEHRVCFFATEEGGQPRVRAFGLWFADEKGFYFQTESVKSVCSQLRSNNKVELCFYAPQPAPGTLMRVTGEVEFVEDLSLKGRVLSERPFLKALGIKGPEDPLLVVFRVRSGEACFWTMANNMKEREIERIKF
jgi:pyridoxamine 5'-phosphate oxidase